mgnify:CR=1 FL=1
MSRKLHFPDLSAIVLAGGQSRRMGQNKASLLIEGQTLLEHLLGQLQGRFKEIIVSLSSKQKVPVNLALIVQDLYEGAGPLAGILSGLKVCQSEVALVLTVDQPEVNFRLVREMLALMTDLELVYPMIEGKIPHPLFALYHKRTIPVMEELIGQGKLSPLELLNRVQARSLTVSTAEIPWNLNTPEDFNRYLRYYKHKKAKAETPQEPKG